VSWFVGELSSSKGTVFISDAPTASVTR